MHPLFEVLLQRSIDLAAAVQFDDTGAIIGGIALGIIETFGASYISVPYKDAFAFLVLIAFLVFRPQGIFGERVAEKA